MAHPLTAGTWLNPSPGAVVDAEGVRITTTPGTDLWQRTYYGFRTDNAPARLLTSSDDVTLTVRATFAYRRRYDQAGLLVRHDAGSWAKASIEHEDDRRSRLGSVVTNAAWSDWATRDITSTERCWFRVSRRGPDFRFEAGPDGESWEQLRIFHLHPLGDTTADDGIRPTRAAPVGIGVYACSPESSSFEARFDRITLEPSLWASHA